MAVIKQVVEKYGGEWGRQRKNINPRNARRLAKKASKKNHNKRVGG